MIFLGGFFQRGRLKKNQISPITKLFVTKSTSIPSQTFPSSLQVSNFFSNSLRHKGFTEFRVWRSFEFLCVGRICVGLMVRGEKGVVDWGEKESRIWAQKVSRCNPAFFKNSHNCNSFLCSIQKTKMTLHVSNNRRTLLMAYSNGTIGCVKKSSATASPVQPADPLGGVGGGSAFFFLFL